jgi:glycosyltransferase involved in cell wall biosynthesis
MSGQYSVVENKSAVDSSMKIDLQESKAPLVSIITPVYNAARWLPETLACVQAQTFADWEHILIDDGSTDDSLGIIETASSLDARVRAVRSPGRSGPSRARNQGMDVARGRFIAFLDADDLWHTEKLARSVEWMTRHGYCFIYHDYRHMSADGSRVGALISGPDELNLYTLHTRRGTGGCLSVVIDRQQIPWVRFPLNLTVVHEDFCCWLSIIQAGKIGHRLPADLGRYRLSANSRSANRLKGIVESWKMYRRYSKLPLLRAAVWWTQYVCNSVLTYGRARPQLTQFNGTAVDLFQSR